MRRSHRPLLGILIFVWFLALLLAGGLIGASSLGVFAVPTLALPTPHATGPAPGPLPPTWTPGAPPEAIDEAPPTPAGSASGPHFEPTFTPAEPFPPNPTFIFTPVPFSDGPIVIGTSVGGRPIEVYRFGTGPVHRMIVAGIHGGYEWNTTALADELITHIQANPDIIPHTVTLYILRTLNPDGLVRALGVAGRVNNHGVDLNRNFPVNWADDWNRTLCWNYTPTSSGTGPGSEPETQALIDFVTTQTRVTALISYHSAALGIFPGGDPPHEPSVKLAEALAAVSTYPYPPLDIGCVYTGTLPDWAAAEGIASVDLELHTHVFTDFEENLEILEAFLEWRR
ncbi:MAG TPA: M14 family zinc carboxypeptidase [Anaerolineales bacterium]|nr:M14 family zinc carboxypeptidase [Anaerolineales bacterium]